MNKKPSRCLINAQMTLDELNSLRPMLRSRIIERAHRKSAREQKLQHFQDALDYEEDP